MAAVFIAQVQRLAAGIAHRVVVPRRQAVFVGVGAPGIGATAFGDHAAKLRVGQHVGPGRRGGVAGAQGDDIFAAVRRKPTVGVAQQQLGINARRRWRHALGSAQMAGIEARQGDFNPAAMHLLVQAAAVAGEHDARHGLHQGAVFRRQLLGTAHEDAAWAVNQVGFDAGGDQPHDQVL